MRMELLTHNKPSSPDPLHQEVTFKRPLSYMKMENLIKEMQDPEHGVPVRSQKLFLTSIPAAFAGYDVIEWLMERLTIEDSVEAIHLANLLCQHGYFFPVTDNRQFSVKDDGSLYRFQTPYYWPSQYPLMDSVDYAIFLAKRTLRNKQKHGLDDYELESLNQLRKNLSQKWDFISMQADEQVRISKERKKVDKLVTDAQERAFWRVLRPPPGSSCCVETPPMHKHDFHAKEGVKQIRRTNLIEDLRAEVDLLRTSCIRTRIKVSQALESLASHCEAYDEHDPFLVPRQPSNPWISDDPCYWIINAPLIEIPTERRVKKWAISMEDLVLDPTGLREITAYLKKEYCHENIRFWLAVRDLRYGPVSQLRSKAQQLYNEFLSPGAPCEINIDMRTMEAVQKELNYLTPARFTFDPAAEHVYTMLLKKDCYPRFIRSEQYKTLLANALQPINQKKRLDKFLSYLALGKKKSSTATPPIYPVGGVLSIPPANMGLGEMFKAADEAIMMATGNKSDLLSASSLDTDKLSVMADCPYRSQGSFDDVCPWESMEKLPEKAPSLSQSVASSSITTASINKPCTSAAALAAAAVPTLAPTVLPPPLKPVELESSSLPQVFSGSSTGLLSKQVSITSTTSTVVSPTPAQKQSPPSSSTTINSTVDNQKNKVVVGSPPLPPPPFSSSPPQQQQQLQPQPSTSGSCSMEAGSTVTIPIIGSASNSTSTSKESVVQAMSPAKTTKTSDNFMKTSEQAMTCQPQALSSIPPQNLNMQDETVVDNVPSCSTSIYNPAPLPPPQASASSSISMPQAQNQGKMTSEDNNKPSGEESKDICPWDHENGTRPESITFVKTYSTLGYL